MKNQGSSSFLVEEKSVHYNKLKLFATILVVLAHASRMYTGKGVVSPVNPSMFLSNVTDYIYSFHMPLFIAISGMVYGLCIEDLKKYDDSIMFLKNKTIRLLMPYLFFGLFYVAPVMVLFNFTSESYLNYCIQGILLVKNSRHLWYLISLFEIYMVFMLIKPLLKNKIFNVILGVIFLAGAVFYKVIPNVLGIQYLVRYILYFYLGFFVNRYYKRIIGVIKHPVCLLMLLGMTIVLFKYSGIVGVIVALCGSMMLMGLTSYVKDSVCIQYLNKNGFGIYLFHPMIIYVLYYYLGKYNVNPIVLCLGITVISYCLSIALTELLRRIKLKILIGE